MESEIGKVIEAGAGRARVMVSKSSLCDQCEAASICIPGMGSDRIVEVADPIGVSVHQQVRIELSSGKLLGASFLAYIVPLLCLFAGTALGVYLDRSTSKELGGSIGAVAGLVVGLMVSPLCGRYFGKRGKLTPSITGILANGDMEEEEG